MGKSKGLFVFVLLLILLCASAYVYYFYGTSELATELENESIDLEALALPDNSGDLVVHSGYTLCYSEEHEQPYWVAYVITPEELNAKSVERNDSFKPDPAISTGSASLTDYKGSSYDRGHMAPFADLSYSEESASDSFYLSNMSPQNSSLNRGKWAELEKLVRSFAEEEPVCVVTGPILQDGPYATIGENKVSVPNYYFKVVLDYVGEEMKAIGFILPNSKCSENLEAYVVSVNEVEARTGLDFFPLLPDSVEEDLESYSNFAAWSGSTNFN